MTVSSAQDAGYDPVKMQQDVERLRRLLEAGEQTRQQGQPVTQRAQEGQQGQQGTQQVGQQAVVLRPEDTGKSVVTFSLGDLSPVSDRFAIKTNLLYAGATLTPNIGFESGLGRRTSIGLMVGFNKWGNLWDNADTGPEYDPGNLYKRRLDHIYGKMEFRYWLRERFDGHFVGANLFYGDYKAGEINLPLIFEKRYDHAGNVYGGGFLYGYLWQWTPRWGVEFTLGMGIAVLEYDKKLIVIGDDGIDPIDPTRFRKTYFGPTSVGINLVFKL